MGLTGTNHVNLTVTDLERSVSWYERVFDLVAVTDESECPPVTSSPIRYRSLFDPVTMSYVVGLIEHPDGDGTRFDERRTGLDHLGWHVDDPSELEGWVRRLDELGIEHSGIKTLDYADVISFRDPDNIQLELSCPNLAFWGPRVVTKTS
jgi:glyoxylase I family protein